MNAIHLTHNALPFRNQIKDLSCTSKIALSVAIISALVAVVIVGLGVAGIFGAVGNFGFFASIVGGSAVMLMAVSAIIYIGVKQYKSPQFPKIIQNQLLTEESETY